MSFGEAFGKLIKRLRGVEGMTQQELAEKAFGDASYKTRISELENGKVKSPQTKTIDALIVALNIPQQEINSILNETPHPQMAGNVVDFFDLDGKGSVDIEIATNTDGKIVVFHNRHLKVGLKRIEYFVEEAQFIFLQEDGAHRRPAGLPMKSGVEENLLKGSEVLFVYLDDDTGNTIEGLKYPLKIVY